MATIHGTDILDDVRLAVKGLLDALKTAMDSASDDPRPAAIYNRHETVIASANLPAVTVEVVGTEGITDEQSGSASSGVYTLSYNINCEIRVHTNYIYEGAYVDTVKISRLLNSIMNYIMTNGRSYFQTNITNYMRTEYETSELDWPVEFEESQTVGGAYKFDIMVNRSHTQA